MIQPILLRLYETNMTSLIEEVKAYKDERNMWKVQGEIANSGGNLVMHLIGNLRGFVGALIGGTDYVRKRNIEFTIKDVPRADMLAELDQTWADVKMTLSKVTDVDLAKVYDVPGTEHSLSGAVLLIYFLEHLAYHKGQINYHRRLLDVTNV